MTNHDLSAGGDVLDRVTAFARAALADYGIHPDVDVRLLFSGKMKRPRRGAGAVG